MSLNPETFAASVADYLAASFEVAEVLVDNVVKASVGWSHQSWLFDAHWRGGEAPVTRGLCLRLDPGTSLLRAETDLAQQFDVLKCLAGTSLPTPTPLVLEKDDSFLGGQFLIMDKLPGVCPSPWSPDGAAFYHDAAGRGKLPLSFTDTLVALHTLDWEAAGLAFLKAPNAEDAFALTEVRKWQELINQTDFAGHPVLTDLLCWLTENAPSPTRLSLVHGAYRTGNLLIDDDQISGVLDWELQVIGDPLYDVAYVLSALNRAGTLLSDVVEQDQFLARYQAGTQIDVDLQICTYYQALYTLRTAAFWISAHDLYRSRRSDDLRLARTEWSIPVVLDQAAELLNY
ncbi:phosphotransferase family protein [Nocardia rhamnosiphila]|uniref:Phosphotransferase family protein n=1 Tax=Nocardia rhamnosiphila TaxID=426716 RepID=A0ABV2X262_9NOCA